MRGALAALAIAALVAVATAPAARAQQAVRLPLIDGGPPAALSGILFRPAASRGPMPAVAIFHGCGGVGVNVTRMAQRFSGQGIAALLVDSFSARGIVAACTRNWPTIAQAKDRTRDIDAAITWLSAQPFIAADRVMVMGYSYGGGVALLRALRADKALAARAVIAVYPDCALLDTEPALAARQPILMAMAELDDWTPVRQCQAMLSRVAPGRALVDTRAYPGAHHSFDAVGLPVTYLAAAGNNSKPNRCCGAHYGHHAPSYASFLRDVDAFVERHLR